MLLSTQIKENKAMLEALNAELAQLQADDALKKLQDIRAVEATETCV
jgi:hypothetical protein